MTNAEQIRHCPRCHEDHPSTFFNRDKYRPDGVYLYCKNCSRAACREVYGKYADRHKKLKRRWKVENRPRKLEVDVKWRAENVRRANAHAANYRARKLGAMPPWAKVEQILMVYDMCPSGYHVDHIHPLRGKDFCGLHAPHNLQFLPAFENFSKNNRLPADVGVLKNV